MATKSARVLAIGADGIAKVYTAGFLVERVQDGFLAGEAVWLSATLAAASQYYFELNGQQITSLSCPSLTSVSEYLDWGRNRIASLSFPVLESITSPRGYLALYDNPFSDTVFPALTSISGSGSQLDMSQGTETTGDFHSISFPVLTTVVGGGSNATIRLKKNASLSSVSMPSLSAINKADLDFSACALSESSVNDILICINRARTGTLIFLNLSGGTSAAPTGAGLAAKTAMSDAGCVITTN